MECAASTLSSYPTVLTYKDTKGEFTTRKKIAKFSRPSKRKMFCFDLAFGWVPEICLRKNVNKRSGIILLSNDDFQRIILFYLPMH